MQSLADGLAIVVDGLHGPTVPVRVARHVTPLLDSIVVALTDLAGELAGAELWRDITPAAIVNGHGPRNYRAEYRARVERMARRL